MSESGDYDPGPWKGYDFRSARASYDKHVGRSYDAAVSKNVGKTDLIVESLKTNSQSPLVIACDVTGSMGDWPATIFSKLPYLDLEGKTYLGEDMEISFAAVGDMFSDKYPLQVRPFCSGTDMKTKLEELVIEGGGGGSTQESYDLAALYYAKNCEMPNAVKPIFIFIGDEGLYDFVAEDGASTYCKVVLEGVRTSMEQVFADLQQKFSVYLIRKPYGSSGNSFNSTDDRITKQWAKLIGDDHICALPDAARVVDVIFGILAKETGKIDYFKKEITDRQEKDKVNVVMKSLMSIHLKNLPAPRSASITRRKNIDDDTDLPMSKSLLD